MKPWMYKLKTCESCGYTCRECEIEHHRTQAARTNCPNDLAQEELWEDVCPECSAVGEFQDATEQEIIDYECDTDGGKCPGDETDRVFDELRGDR